MYIFYFVYIRILSVSHTRQNIQAREAKMRVTGITNTRKYISNESDMKLSVRRTTNVNTSKLLASPNFGSKAENYVKIGREVLDRLIINDKEAFVKELKNLKSSRNEEIFINLRATDVTGYLDVAFRISTRPNNFVLKHLYTLAKNVGHLIKGENGSRWWTKKGILNNGEIDSFIIQRFKSIINKDNY